MANSLYDTGEPQRVIVENPPEPETHIVERLVVFPLCENCGRQTRTVPCEWCENKRNGTVTITPSIEAGKPIRMLQRANAEESQPTKDSPRRAPTKKELMTVSEKTLPPGIVLATLSDAQSLIKDLKVSVGQLDRVKKGDFITLMLKFPPPPVTYIDKDGNKQIAPADPSAPKYASEFLSCLVSNLSANGLIHCRVMSNPTLSSIHSAKYGDDFSVYPQYVIRHEPGQPGDVSKTAHLLEDLQPIPPIVGKTYWTRDGATASVWTAMQAGQEQYLLGEVSWPSGVGREGIRNVEWLPDGRNRQGNRDLDIVRDPTVKVVEEFPQVVTG